MKTTIFVYISSAKSALYFPRIKPVLSEELLTKVIENFIELH